MKKPPTPDALLDAAREKPVQYFGPFASDYVHVVQELRDRNYGWADITGFFHEKGLPFSTQSLFAAWRKWSRRQEALLKEADALSRRADAILEVVG